MRGIGRNIKGNHAGRFSLLCDVLCGGYSGIFLMGASYVFATAGADAFRFILFVVSITFVVQGIRELLYYLLMARHMVGGALILIKAVILIAIGVLAELVQNGSTTNLMILYLLSGHVIKGVIDILRAREAKQLEAGSWKLNMSYGITNILIAVFTFVFGMIFKSLDVVVFVYGAGLFYSSVIRIIRACRRTAMVYIQ